MSDNLKRVGLVFNADGSVNFVKSLKLINAELRENHANFKLVQEQWDKSTNATQKLRDKLVYLNEAYTIQGDKVATLRDQLQALENAEKKDETAIQQTRAALAQAETSLQRYQNQINDVNNKLKTGSEQIKEYGENIKKAGDKIEKAGQKFSAFSAASAAALTASAKSAIEFESAFAGVEKTVDATDEELDELRQGIRNLAKEIPSTTTEIAGVAEIAGQLGIKTENILSFSKAMIDLGNSTNLSAQDAATQLAKLANITQMSQENFDKLGSALVDLGNNYATTEADISDMALRLAGAGHQVGLSEGQILGLATALSSVGIEAEMGGSAISRVMVKMQNSIELGAGKLNDVLKKTGMSLRDLQLMSKNNTKDFKALSQSLGLTKTELEQMIKSGVELKAFADISGVSAEQFKKSWEEDAGGALTAFIKGLGTAEEKGESAITLLTEMGITEIRLRDSLLRAANAGNLFSEAMQMGNEAFEENVALTNEANKRYATLKSKIQIALNKIQDIGITLGNKLMPHIEKLLNKVEDWAKKIERLDDKQLDFIINLGVFVAALSPVLTTIGKITSGIGGAVVAYGKFREGLGLMITKAEASSKAMTGILTAIQAMTSPLGLACTAIGLAIAGVAIASNKANKEIQKDFETMGNSATDFIRGIDNAQSHLSSFNSTLFASAEEQQELTKNMEEVQKGITDICKRASDERRGYTDNEIKQLDEYFVKLRELNNREIEIQSQIATAITQQAVTNAESFKGSLDEYKTQSQEWIKTAIEQKDATIALIEQGTTQEIILLNQRYATEDEKQTEAYKNEYNKIMEHKQAKIDAANDEVAKICDVYANGYLERDKQNNGFYSVLEEYNKKVEKENERHQKKIEDIEDKGILVANYTEDENKKHQQNMKKIWKDIYKDMSDSQTEQLGVWLALQSDAELHGKEISDEAKQMVDAIMENLDSMPRKTRETMKNAMSPMLEEMQKKEPSLFNKATNIANGILSRLKKSFDIHSPSRKMRKLFNQVMQGAEIGLQDEEKSLYNKVDDISKNINDSFEDVNNIGINAVKRTNTNNKLELIDYDKLTKAMLKALNSCKMEIDEDGFVRMVDNRLSEVL